MGVSWGNKKITDRQGSVRVTKWFEMKINTALFPISPIAKDRWELNVPVKDVKYVLFPISPIAKDRWEANTYIRTLCQHEFPISPIAKDRWEKAKNRSYSIDRQVSNKSDRQGSVRVVYLLLTARDYFDVSNKSDRQGSVRGNVTSQYRNFCFLVSNKSDRQGSVRGR